MKRFVRHTEKVSLGIATIVMILHLLIPHDHHQENLCLHQDNTPVSENHHHNRMPEHCHAFNDLTYEEKSIVIAKTVSFDNFTAIIDLFHIKYICEFSAETYSDFFTSIQSSGEPELSSLRAPPSFS